MNDSMCRGDRLHCVFMLLCVFVASTARHGQSGRQAIPQPFENTDHDRVEEEGVTTC